MRVYRVEYKAYEEVVIHAIARFSASSIAEALDEAEKRKHRFGSDLRIASITEEYKLDN